jgi:protoheme IX farnesyltransferase
MADFNTTSITLPISRQLRPMPKKLLAEYYRLTKPGIVYSNVMTAAAGYLLASKIDINWLTFLTLLAGTGLIIASACTYNNYLDRNIDKKMERTKNRAIVSGAISGLSALLFASFLGVLGFIFLIFTTWLTVILGAFALFSYVVLYGLAKRNSVHGTLVGTLPGSAPLVAGYATFSGQLSLALLLLFLIMVCWQMAHFYSIAIYRQDDYKAASLPVWPVKKGVVSTKRAIALYAGGFVLSALLLRVFGYVGNTFAVIMVSLGMSWLYLILRGLTGVDDRRWARKVFLYSLVVLLTLSVMLSLGSILP